MDSRGTDIGGLLAVGWREWGALPGLGIPAIKMKIDTGARTSTLHAFELDRFRRGGKDWVRFLIHPLQRRTDIVVVCETPLIEERIVSDSGGHREKRYVIETPLRLGSREWAIELTLTSRDSMLFRMLLGRSAMCDHIEVIPSKSYIGAPRVRRAYRLYAALKGKE